MKSRQFIRTNNGKIYLDQVVIEEEISYTLDDIPGNIIQEINNIEDPVEKVKHLRRATKWGLKESYDFVKEFCMWKGKPK